MSITTTPHLNFRGTAREALDFYATVFGGETVAVTYGDAHAAQDAAEADQIMWGQVQTAAGFHVMAYDVPSAQPHDTGANAYFVSVRGDDAEELTSHFERLADGGTVRQPLGPTGWAPLYGMVEDRFGVVWVLDVVGAPAGA